MIYVYTRTNKYLYSEYWRNTIRRVLGGTRGPQGVLASLTRGLTEIGFQYEVNPVKFPEKSTVHILSGVQALRDALELKQQGKIGKLIVGPNVVVTPTDHDSLIMNPLIDVILVPSKWVRDLYTLCNSELSSRTKIWPAGVQIPPQNNNIEPRFDCLVFKKNIPEKLYRDIISVLNKKNIRYKIIVYGKYSQPEYFHSLYQCRYMIYLQNVESQGLAIQEAWARNVPTLVWNPGKFTYPQGYTIHGNICAPYLSNANGKYFEGIGDFALTLDNFINSLSTFTPRIDCIQRLSDRASAEAYVKIIEITQNE